MRPGTRLNKLMVLVMAAFPGAGHAQAVPGAAPKLSPEAAYEQAQRPFEIVHRAPQNWSEIELEAYKVATGQAKASCLDSAQEVYAGEDLIGYARLCSFGQAWEQVERSALLYIRAAEVAAGEGKPMPARSLSMAFDYEVQASLRLKKPTEALHACQAMLNTVPYDELAADAVDTTAPYLQFTSLKDAVTLLKQRQAIVLPMLQTPAARGVLTVRTLYAEAIALPSMEQYAGLPVDAAVSFTEVEQAVPATLGPDDALGISESRSRYHLLGAPLPAMDHFAWLMDATGRGVAPELNAATGEATVLLLFPDWCTQCVAMHPQFGGEWKRLREDRVRFFALLAQAKAPLDTGATESAKRASGSAKVAPFAGEKAGTPHNELQLDIKPTAAAFLAGTPTFVVPNKTLKDFAAEDFPLIIVADRDGVIRAMQVTNETALEEGGQIDQMVEHVNEVWAEKR